MAIRHLGSAVPTISAVGLGIALLMSSGCGSGKGVATFEELNDLALAGQYDEIDFALKRDGTVNRQDQYGMTLLSAGCYEGDVKLVKLLLSHNARIDLVDKNGYCALHWAAISKSVKASTEIIGILLGKGASVDSRSEDLSTPLYLACRASYSEAEPALERVSLLLRAGADPNAKCWEGEHPLHQAASRANDKVIRALLDAGADPSALDSTGRTPLKTLLWRRSQLPKEANPVPLPFDISEALLLWAAHPPRVPPGPPAKQSPFKTFEAYLEAMEMVGDRDQQKKMFDKELEGTSVSWVGTLSSVEPGQVDGDFIAFVSPSSDPDHQLAAWYSWKVWLPYLRSLKQGDTVRVDGILRRYLDAGPSLQGVRIERIEQAKN